jgi:hypothetical protein
MDFWNILEYYWIIGIFWNIMDYSGLLLNLYTQIIVASPIALYRSRNFDVYPMTSNSRNSNLKSSNWNSNDNYFAIKATLIICSISFITFALCIKHDQNSIPLICTIKYFSAYTPFNGVFFSFWLKIQLLDTKFFLLFKFQIRWRRVNYLFCLIIEWFSFIENS